MPPPIRPFVPIALYEGALDALPLGLLVFRLDDPDDPGSLRLLYGNDAADRTTGADFRANLGRTIGEFLPSLLETELPERYAEVARTGRERDLGDVRFGGDAVKEALYAVRAFGLPDQSVGVLFEDVTETRSDEDRRMQEVTGLADAALEGIALSDGGRVLLANRALAEMTGYTREELAGLDVLDLAAEGHREAIHARVEARNTEPYEAALRRKDGTEFPVDIRGRYVEYNGTTVRATAVRDLSERVQALREMHALRETEAALRESESRYRLLADTATDVIVTVGTDNVIRYANRAAETVFGYPPEALVGQSLTMLMPEEYRALHEAAMARYVDGGEKRLNWGHVEAPGMRKDGTTFPLNISFGEYRHGEDRLFTGILRDVSAQEAAREALAESEATLRAMVEQATVGVIVTDPTTGAFLRVNERFAALTGRTPEELLGMSLFALLPPEERDADREAFAAMARGEAPEYAREMRYVLPDGTLRWIYATARPLDVGGGGPVRALHVVQDVTERRDAEVAVHRALRHAEAAEGRLIAVVDNLPELAWAARPDGHIDFYNRRWYDYTGATLDQMEGWGWKDVHDPAILPEVEERWQRALATGETFEMEFPLRGADGAFRWFLTRAHPIRDADGTIVRWVGTNTDIDEQRRLLAERDAALARTAEGEARLRLVVRATNDAVWDWDLAADRVVWNRALEERFGWAEAAAEGTDGAWWKAHIHPDDRERVVGAIEAVVDGAAETWQTEYRFARADGGWADVFDRGSVVRDADGAPVRMVGAMIDLTEQKRAERALRESERQFRLLTDAVPQLVWTASAEGTPDYYNERWYAYTGMARPEANGGALETDWGAYVHPDDRPGAFAAFARAAEAAAPFEYEYRFRRHDGEYRWFLGRALPTLDDGRVVRWVGSAIDIQELREAREAMAASEAQARAVFEQAGVGVVVMDPTTGEFLRVNERYTEMAGRPTEELLGVSVFDFIHPDDRERDRALFARLARRETPTIAHEKRYLHPDGSVRWVKVDARLLPGAEGARLRAVSVLQDVTEERRAEAALRESEARFRAIADTMPQIAWTTRPDGYHEYFNERWYEYTGMPRPGEPGGLDQGFNWKDYLHPDDVERSLERWRHSLETGAPYEVEYRFRRAADGAYRWFIGRAAPVRDDEGAIVRWYGTSTDIQEQKEAARLLERRVAERTAEAREAAERLDAVLNGTTDLIAAIDTNYRVLAVNAGFGALWERVFGFPIRVGMTLEEALPDEPEEQAKSRAQWGRVLAGESFTTLEASEHPVLGKVAFEAHYSPIRDADGAVTGGVAVIRDVTDREQAAQAVEAFAADLRQLHGVTTADHDSTEALLEDYLRAGRAILGLPIAAVVETDEAAGTWHARAGLAPEGVALPEGGPLAGTTTALVLQRGATLAVADTEAVEDEAERASLAVAALGVRSYVGTPIYVGDAVAGVLGFASPTPRGAPLAPHEVEIVEILAELIGRALAVEHARRAERTADLRYRTLVEAMDEGVVLHDADARVVAWNEAAERALGLSADQMAGRSSVDGRWRTVHDDGRPFPGEEHPAVVAIRTGEPQRNVIMGVYHPSGELRWLTVNAAPIHDDEGADDGRPSGAVASFADVTALKRAEETLRQRGAELEERNAELEQFAYVASHDLQEPLRTVASFLQLLERRYADDLDARAQEYIAFAVDGSRRMQALIQGLLAYSRVGTRGRPFEPVDAGAVARDVLVDLGPALGEAGAVVEADELPVVCADPTQLHQLFLNLVSNAVKFRREGVPARVAIAVEKGREGGRPAWTFTVSDNGIGLDPKYADRVFQLFQRLHTRDEYPGTGIGLAVCKKIVERHGGTLGYSPSPEGGTTFTFTLPIRPLDACDAPPVHGGPNLADAE